MPGAPVRGEVRGVATGKPETTGSEAEGAPSPGVAEPARQARRPPDGKAAGCIPAHFSSSTFSIRGVGKNARCPRQRTVPLRSMTAAAGIPATL